MLITALSAQKAIQQAIETTFNRIKDGVAVQCDERVYTNSLWVVRGTEVTILEELQDFIVANQTFLGGDRFSIKSIYVKEDKDDIEIGVHGFYYRAEHTDMLYNGILVDLKPI